MLSNFHLMWGMIMFSKDDMMLTSFVQIYRNLLVAFQNVKKGQKISWVYQNQKKKADMRKWTVQPSGSSMIKTLAMFKGLSV